MSAVNVLECHHPAAMWHVKGSPAFAYGRTRLSRIHASIKRLREMRADLWPTLSVQSAYRRSIQLYSHESEVLERQAIVLNEVIIGFDRWTLSLTFGGQVT